MKILTIVPSINPARLATMLDSFLMTRSECTDIRIRYEIGNVTDIFNKTFQENPDYDFYHMTNDDTVYRTPHWDIKLAQKGKITYGDDLFQRDNLCTFPMIDGDIVRALGYLQLPTLKRGYCSDNIWKMIGEQIGILEYHPEVVIEHKWDGKIDEELNKHDMQRFAEWLPHMHKDVEKIRGALCQSK